MSKLKVQNKKNKHSKQHSSQKLSSKKEINKRSRSISRSPSRRIGSREKKSEEKIDSGVKQDLDLEKSSKNRKSKMRLSVRRTNQKIEGENEILNMKYIKKHFKELKINH